MKKTLLLALLVGLALIIDGTMTYDVFEFREETRGGWMMVLLAVILLVIIFVADTSKKHEDKDNSG